MNNDRMYDYSSWLGCALSASAIFTSLYPHSRGEERQPKFSDHL